MNGTYRTPVLLGALMALLLIALLAVPAGAAEWKIVNDEEWCKDRSSSSRYCEVRETVFKAGDRISVENVNEGIVVTGWDGTEVKVQARVTIRGNDADETAREIEIHTEDGEIHATGPRRGRTYKWFGNRDDWSVSYRVWVPEGTNIALQSVNGGIRVKAVSGDIMFETVNGGVTIADAGGDVKGSTVNGGVRVLLNAKGYDGSNVDVSTTNGGVKVGLPADIKATIDASTVNGGVSVAQPIVIEKKSRNRLRGTIGGGGDVTLRVRTTNGGVKFGALDI